MAESRLRERVRITDAQGNETSGEIDVVRWDLSELQE